MTRIADDDVLIGLIKKQGGGGQGGTSNYEDLENKPKIDGTTLSGNKSLADLGIASASDLAAKQNALTAGDYVVIKNDKISVSKLKQGELDLYSYEFVSTDTSHTPKVKVVKKVNGETISETVYDEFQAANWMTFDDIIRFRYDASDSYKWKYQCLVTSNEHVKDTVVSWYWNQAVDYTETFDVGASAITDLVTKGDMNEALATKQDTLTFDNVPTQNSTNPVKSGGVYSALAGKQDTLTFDDTPTDGSNNPVKSNGIYDSEKDIYAAMGEMGAKNLIQYPYNGAISGTGISWTVNNDGSIVANGQAESNSAFWCVIYSQKYLCGIKKGKSYIVNGISGGSANTYQIYVATFLGSTQQEIWFVTDGDKVFTPTQDFDGVSIYCRIASGTSVSDLVFRPMLRLASDTDNTYQPYAKTNKQLTDDVALLDSEKADTDMVASDFDATASYTAGNYCIYEGKFYKFKNNHSGAWSAADVDEIKIAGELSSLKSGLTGVNYPLVDSVMGATITRLRGNVTKISNVVTITGAWTGSATNTDVITLIPEGFRPSGAVAVMGSGTIDNAGTLAYAEYSVLPSGQLRQAQVVGAVSGGTFTITYAI